MATRALRTLHGRADHGVHESNDRTVAAAALLPADGGVLHPDDTIDGTASSELLSGTENDDTISGLDGSDTIYGYGGNDLLDGGNAYDAIYGGTGGDTIIGGSDSNNNYLSGDAGDDSITGAAGNDNVIGGNGNDTLNGGDGNDTISDYESDSIASANFADAGAGNDRISVQAYNAGSTITVTGGTGTDTYDLQSSSLGTVIISDFATGAGGDLVNIDYLLQASTGYVSGNPFRANLGFLRIQQDGADSLLQWDRDGTAGGTYTWRTVVRFSNVAPAALVAQNFAPSAPPDGSNVGVNVSGTAAADTIFGSVVNDTLAGVEGNDQLYGYGGNDRLDGGTDFDYLYGGIGNDTLIGGLAGDTSGNYIQGDAGNDRLTGTAGYDNLYGGYGSDTLIGGGGNDYLTETEYDSAATTNVINGGSGDDYIYVYSYNAASVTTVTGGPGKDHITLDTSSLASLVMTDFDAGAGGDIIEIDALLNSTTGYSGGNPFDPALGILRLVQDGGDTLLQWDQDGTDTGYAWRTLIRLEGVAPVALVAANFMPYAPPDGSPVSRNLNGTLNGDTLEGSVGNDTLSGLAGYDTLRGYGGDDLLQGGTEYDNLYGGAGDDTMIGGPAADASGDYFSGGDGDDSIRGGDQSDALYGDSGSDTIVGGAGNDYLYDDNGDYKATANSLDGGDGNDWFRAYGNVSTAVTTATGGTGQDTFELTYYSIGQLIITDFVTGAGGDVLYISTLVSNSSGFPGGNPLDGSLQYFRFVQQGAATLVQWDRDGSGGSYAWRTMARLEGVAAGDLTSENFGPVSDVSAIALVTNHLPGGTVQIDGDALVGTLLTASNTLADSDGIGTVSYQWLRDNVDINGATTSTYTLGVDDVGHSIRVRASYTDGQEMPESRTSTATSIVDDFTGDAGTSGALGVGTESGGVIQQAGDSDWFSITLQAGIHYSFVLTGAATDDGTLADPYLQLFDADGALLAENDDAGGGTLNSRIEFTALADGTYFVAASGFATDTGTYELKVLEGPAENLRLLGTGGADTLIGGAGNDWLDGRAGADSMAGGLGNDTYVVDQAGDVVGEQSGNGTDTVMSGIGYTLGPNTEKLVLTGIADINGGGNARANAITGNAGANLLNGAAGADVLSGGAGDDIFVVDDAGDRTVEYSGQGTDTVRSTVDWTLGANIEKLLVIGAGAADGSGNALANEMTGNDASNAFDGAAGADTLSGGDGNDTLQGEAGADLLDGGNGLDWAGYAAAAQGVTVSLALAGAQNTVGAGTDTLTGIENLAGSAHDDTLTGDGSTNILRGAAGDDTLVGGGGNDTLVGGDGVDQLTGGAGADRFDFNLADETGIAPATRDTITDFTSGQNDLIDISGIDADSSSAGTDQAFTFIGTAAFSGVDATGQLRYNNVSGVLFGSTDADNDAEFSILLTGVASLASGDFIL